MSPYVIALDVGGTGMKAALLGPQPTLRPLRETRRETPRDHGPEAVVDALLDLVAELRTWGVENLGAEPAAAGIVAPGVIDEEHGSVAYSANLGWRDLPLRTLVRERLERGVGAAPPVAVGHDVRTGGLAEGRIGAGKGVDRFLFVPLGTGIAGAIGINGRVEPGAHGGAGEIGHIVVRPGGPPCGCGRRGCLEALASAGAVGRAWGAACGDPAASAADAAAAVESGDRRAAAVWRDAVAALADGLVTGLTLLDPETLVIGGGLAEAGETLFAPLREAVRERVTFQHVPTIVPAALGDAAGCLGAGLLAWDLLAAEVNTV